jgi:hypothetical protein
LELLACNNNNDNNNNNNNKGCLLAVATASSLQPLAYNLQVITYAVKYLTNVPQAANRQPVPKKKHIQDSQPCSLCCRESNMPQNSTKKWRTEADINERFLHGVFASKCGALVSFLVLSTKYCPV